MPPLAALSEAMPGWLAAHPLIATYEIPLAESRRLTWAIRQQPAVTGLPKVDGCSLASAAYLVTQRDAQGVSLHEAATLPEAEQLVLRLMQTAVSHSLRALTPLTTLLAAMTDVEAAFGATAALRDFQVG